MPFTVRFQLEFNKYNRLYVDPKQPPPQGLLLVQNGGRRKPPGQRFVRILSRKHDEMSSLRLNNGFRL